MNQLEEVLTAYLLAGYEPSLFICSTKDKEEIFAYYGRPPGDDTDSIQTDFGRFLFKFDDSTPEKTVQMDMFPSNTEPLRPLPAYLSPSGVVIAI